MVLYLIVGCGNKAGKIRHVLLTAKEELTAEWRRWISAITREDLTDSILENDRDCSKNLVSGEPAKDWCRFNVDWLPTLCLGHSKQQVQVKDPEAAEVQSWRAAERRKRWSESLENAIKDRMLKIDEQARQLKKYLEKDWTTDAEQVNSEIEHESDASLDRELRQWTQILRSKSKLV